MPEMWFDIVWPDGQPERCYSPSLVIAETVSEGQSYTVADFMRLIGEALHEASERVRRKYGFPCSRAMAQRATLERGYQRYAGTPDATMRVEKFLSKDA